MAKSYREVRRILSAHGFVIVRTKGSHEQWANAEGVTVTVAGGGKGGQTVPTGTLRSIRRATGIEELR